MTRSFLRELSRLGVLIDRNAQEAVVLAFARQHRLTVYDASYLELAQREALPLATLDKGRSATRLPLLMCRFSQP